MEKGIPFEVSIGVMLLVDLLCESPPSAIDLASTITSVAAQKISEDESSRHDYHLVCQAQDGEQHVFVEVKNRAGDEWIPKALKALWTEIQGDDRAYAALVLGTGSEGRPYRELANAQRSRTEGPTETQTDVARARQLVVTAVGEKEAPEFLRRLFVRLVDLDTRGSNEITRLEESLRAKFQKTNDVEGVIEALKDIVAGNRYVAFKYSRESLLKELQSRGVDPRYPRASLIQGHFIRNAKRCLAGAAATVGVILVAWFALVAPMLRGQDAVALLVEARGLSDTHHDRALGLVASSLRKDPRVLAQALDVIQADRHFVKRFPGIYDIGGFTASQNYLFGIESRSTTMQRRVRFFDLRTKVEAKPFTLRESGDYDACALSEDRVALISDFGAAATLNPPTIEQTIAHSIPSGAETVACSKQSAYVSFRDGRIEGYDGSWVRRFTYRNARFHELRQLAASPDERYVVAAYEGATLVLDARTGLALTLQLDPIGPDAIAFASDGRLVAHENVLPSGDADMSSKLVVRSIPSLHVIETRSTKAANAQAIEFAGDGFAVDEDGFVASPFQTDSFSIGNGEGNSARWSPDGSLIVTPGEHGLFLYSLLESDPLLVGVARSTMNGDHYAFCPDGRILASGIDRGVEQMKPPDLALASIGLDEASNVVVSIDCAGATPIAVTLDSRGRAAYVWSIGDNDASFVTSVKAGGVIRDEALNDAGTILTMLLTNDHIERFNIGSGVRSDVTPSDQQFYGPLMSRRLSNTGRYVLVSNERARVDLIFDLDSHGSVIYARPSNPQRVSEVSPTDSRFMTSGTRGIELWDMGAAQASVTLDRDMGEGAFSFDGTRFLSLTQADGVQRLQLWDARLGTTIGRQFGTTLVNYSVPSFSPDGEYVAATGWGTSSAAPAPIAIWAIGSEALARQACEMIGNGVGLDVPANACPHSQ
jgi:Tol biopolymer transport system component